jgi:hypothetical protein
MLLRLTSPLQTSFRFSTRSTILKL